MSNGNKINGYKLSDTIKAMDEGYAGMLPGGDVVDVRNHPEARLAPGPDGRNAQEWLDSQK